MRTDGSTFIKTRLVFLLFYVISVFGCATSLPDITAAERAYAGGVPAIVGPQGPLSEKESKQTLTNLKRAAGSPQLLEKHVSLMQSLSGFPLTSENRAQLLIDGPATNEAMLRAISKAMDHINLETFIFEDDDVGRQVSELLLRKQTEGVQVNIIYDSLGSKSTPPEFFDRLKMAGAGILEFNPINPLKAKGKAKFVNRDHRKTLIIDGRIAFTGGVNISDVYSTSPSSSPSGGGEKGERKGWRDTHVQIEGPAVAQAQSLFLETWRDQKRVPLVQRNYYPALKQAGNDLVRIIGSAPGEKEALTYLMYLSAIRNAENSIHLTMAYLIPDATTKKVLIDAVKRGVDVKIILPSWSDSNLTLYAGRSHYDDFLDAGIKIYELQKGMLHAKTAVIDGVWSTVGSTNIDMWSFMRNNEINAVIVSLEFARDMENLFNTDLAASKEITRKDWSRRPIWNRLAELVGRLMSHWL